MAIDKYDEDQEVYVISHDDECECVYDDEGNITFYCMKIGVCPNLQ